MPAGREGEEGTPFRPIWSVTLQLFFRQCVYWAVAWSCISVGQSEPLVVRSTQPQTLKNTGPVPLIGIRCQDSTVARLEPGESIELPADGCNQPPVGRIELSSWGLALSNLSDNWAPYHLRTAGHLLDAIEMVHR